MPYYDVYALGNALVDLEYQITAAELEQLGIDKGVMTLVDEAQQLRLMKHLAQHPHHRSAGGSAANTVIALSQFGGRGFYSCKVADDELGRCYLDDLTANGVTTLNSQYLDAGDTGRCVVLVTPDGDRTMCTYLGISGNLSVHEIDRQALCAARYFYTEGYLVTSDTARVAAIEARRIAEQAGVKTALSLSDPNMVKYFKTGLREMIGERVDVLFANESEALGMAETNDLATAMTALQPLARELVITRGSQGAVIVTGNETIEIAAVPVTAIDTVGAGDMFAGAFLYGLTQGWDHYRAGTLAAAAAAQVVTCYGPRLTPEQSQLLLTQVAAAGN